MSLRAAAPAFAILLALAALARGGEGAEEVVLLRDGRELRGGVERDGDALRIATPLVVHTVPLARVVSRAPVSDLDRAPFVHLADPVARIDPKARTGPPVPVACRPRAGSQFSADGRLVRRMELGRDLFDVTYQLTEVHPTHFVLEGIDREHRLHHACEPHLAQFLHAMRAKGIAEASDRAGGWLELARFARLAGWLDLAGEDLARARGAEAEALAAEEAALRRARAEAAAREALAARDRRDPQAGVAALAPHADALDEGGRALLAELEAAAEGLAAARGRLERLAAAHPSLAGQARAEGAALTAEAAERQATLLSGGLEAAVPAEARAAQAELARLRAARRYGRWLDPALRRDLDLEALAAAEVALTAVLAGAPDEVEALLATRLAPLEAALPYPVWEALIRGGAGAAPEAAPATGERRAPAGERGPEVRYLLHVPPSYRPEVAAPLVVLLNGLDDVPEDMLTLWGAFADRHGLLLAAVDYLTIDPNRQTGWHFDALQHHAVLRVAQDVARRCSVDAERVFLAGHSVGGLAAYDLAYSHPDWFAGVIAMIGGHVAYERVYAKHADLVPTYAIGGEHDPSWAEPVRKHVAYVLGRGADITFAEYRTRGHELFWEELVHVAPWLRARARDPYRERFEVAAGRPTDLARFWIEVREASVRLRDRPPQRVRAKRLVRVRARIDRRRNEVRLDLDNVKAATVLLSDRLLDLAAPVRIKVGRKTVFNGEVQRSASGMVRRFLATRDRASLWAAEVALDDLD